MYLTLFSGTHTNLEDTNKVYQSTNTNTGTDNINIWIDSGYTHHTNVVKQLKDIIQRSYYYYKLKRFIMPQQCTHCPCISGPLQHLRLSKHVKRLTFILWLLNQDGCFYCSFHDSIFS